MKKRRVLVVGAGPGGLAAAMILAHKGAAVTVLEKADRVGGRNAALKLGDYTFDTGPTFLLMKYVLDQVFEKTGRRTADYLSFSPLSPMYDLFFSDKKVTVFSEKDKMQAEINRLFPGNEGAVARFHAAEKRRFDRLLPVLEHKSEGVLDLLTARFWRALPYLLTRGSLYDTLARYFKDEQLRLSFTFQAKYLGMSPWDCPGAFTLIPFAEHHFGIFHVEGGLNAIASAQAKVVEEEGGVIRLNTAVRRVTVENGRATGVVLDSGETITADDVVINADFGYAATNLFEPAVLRRYSPDRLKTKKLSCSTAVLYLGLDKQYPNVAHHNIYFARDYRANVADIFSGRVRQDDLSFYLHNPSLIDSTLAPKGHSSLYALFPLANNRSGYDWSKQADNFREAALRQIEERAGLTDIRRHIVTEQLITPRRWETDYNVYFGAIFGLSHHLNQMLLFRPHNRFEEVDHCFLVGASTHPGSGLPTIYQSAMISADLIAKT